MRIESLRLKDFGPHEDLFVDFNASVTGLCGPNGAGKSTILRALRFAFTNLLDDKAETYVRNFQTGPSAPQEAPADSTPPPAALLSPKAEAWESEGQPSALLTEEPAEAAPKKRAPADPDRPANGSVELVFWKGGQRGVIFRQVGKTARRYLEWGERTGKNAIKAEKEMATTLASIFGADQQALDNAVFIPQGEMHHLLFGDDTQREKLYARMLLVSFCASVERVLAEKITALNSGLKDLTATRDEATAYLSATRRELHDLTQTCVSLPDVDAKSLEVFERWCSLTLGMQTADEALTAANTALASAEQTFQEASSNVIRLIGTPDVEKARAARDTLAEAVGKAAANADLLKAKSDAFDNSVTADKEAEAAITELAEAQKELDQVASLIRPAQEITQLSTQLRSANDAKTRMEEIRQIDESLDKHESDLVVKSATAAEKQAAVAPAEAALDAANTAVKQAAPLRLTVDLLERAKAAINPECCPVCKSKVDASVFSAETIASSRQQLAELDKAVAQATTTLRDLRKASETANTEVTALKSTIEGLRRRRSDYLTLAGASNVEHLQLRLLPPERVKEIETLLAEQQTLTAQRPVKQSMVARAQERQGRATQAQLNAAQQLMNAQRAAAGIQSVDAVQLQGDRQRLSMWSAAIDTLDRAATTLELRKKTKSEAETAREQVVRNGQAVVLEINALPLLTDLLRKVGDISDRAQLVQASRKEVNDYRTKVTDANARKRQQERAVAEAEQRHAAVERAITENDRHRTVIEDLQGCQRLFHRDGLPIFYMRMRFGEIVELTSFYLAMLDSDFIVRADPERAVAFQFSRLTATTEVWFSQDKLSGGQRVRLTVAFLLAIQQLVIPDVGLLILDEPSMHLDEAGVDSLREMLQNIGKRLEGIEAQVIVCDHNPTIVSSLSRSTHLTNQIRPSAKHALAH